MSTHNAHCHPTEAPPEDWPASASHSQDFFPRYGCPRSSAVLWHELSRARAFAQLELGYAARQLWKPTVCQSRSPSSLPLGLASIFALLRSKAQASHSPSMCSSGPPTSQRVWFSPKYPSTPICGSTHSLPRQVSAHGKNLPFPLSPHLGARF